MNVDEAWKRLDDDWCPALYEEELTFQAAVRDVALATLDATVAATEESVAAVFALRAKIAALGTPSRVAGEKE